MSSCPSSFIGLPESQYFVHRVSFHHVLRIHSLKGEAVALGCRALVITRCARWCHSAWHFTMLDCCKTSAQVR